MAPDLALAPLLGWAGTVAAALAASGALVLRARRARALAVLAALVLAPALVLGAFAEELARALPGGLAGALGGAAAGALAVAALAALLHRRPGAIVALALVALPFRVPLEAGGQSANLLVPLYAVVAAGCLAYAWRALRGPRGETVTAAASAGAHPAAAAHALAAPGVRRQRRLEIALAAAIAVYAIQSLYSTDVDQAVKNVAFFYVPFALLMRLVLDVRPTRETLARAFAAVVALAVLFAVVGFVEYATGHLLLNPTLVAENQYEAYFRVNSLFFDPSIYGRFLALVMILLTGLLLWTSRRHTAVAVAGALAVLWAGLVLSLSQSSFVALLAGLCVLAALRWRPRRALVGAVAAIAAVALAGILLFPGAFGLQLRDRGGFDRATSGRFDLMAAGIAMFADRPLHGFGSGAFEERFRARERANSLQVAAASHTIPITVAAEQGIVGLAAYVAVLAAALALLFGGLGGMSRRGPPSPASAARAALAAAFVALVAHTWLYAAFLEEPLTWVLLALAGAMRAQPDRSAAPARPANESAANEASGASAERGSALA